MTGLVESVRRKISKKCSQSLIDRFRKKEGCGISLKGAPIPRVIIDFDQCPQLKEQRRCDYLFVAQTSDNKSDWVVALELKKGKANISEAARQLEAGALTAEQFIPQSFKTYFLPVLVYGGTLHSAERKKIKHNQVNFRNGSQPIRLMRCNTPLKTVLRKP